MQKFFISEQCSCNKCVILHISFKKRLTNSIDFINIRFTNNYFNMKKFLMMAVMAVMALTASAQGDYRVTPHVGIGYTNMSNSKFYIPSPVGLKDLDFDISNGFGAIVGVDCEYFLSENFGISGGVDFLYSKGDKEGYKQQGIDTGNYYADYSFLNIPVLAQYHVGNFAFKAGLQPAFLLSADLHAGKEGKASLKDDMKTFSLALPVGVSYDFNSPITLDLRCALPLTKQNDKSFFGKDNKFTAVTLMVGYRF